MRMSLKEGCLFLIKKVTQLIFLAISCLVLFIVTISRIYGKFRGLKSRRSSNLIKQTHKDVFLHPSDVIKLQGYRITEFEFETQDNMYVSLWRVQKNQESESIKQREVILIQHGLLDCSMSWFLNAEKQKCLPYILANANCDVWVGNNRGNKHCGRNSHTDKYWNYCFDDLVDYDLPTLIEGVIKYSECQKLTYIGHSQGSAIFLTSIGLYPHLKNKIKLFIGLGPIIKINHLHQNRFLKIVSKTRICKILKFIGFKSLFILPAWISRITGVLVSNISLLNTLIHIVLMQLCGTTDTRNYDFNRFGVTLAHAPGGGSLNNVIQWMQFYDNKKTSRFDYGATLNKIKYGSVEPPQYTYTHLKQVPFDCHLFVGDRDGLVSPQDFNGLLLNLEESKTKVYVIKNYGHMDYIWGINAHKDIYYKISQLLQCKETEKQCWQTESSEGIKF